MGSLRQSSFGAELHRNFSTGQRQSIHSSYSSSRQEITDDFKFLLKYSSDFHAKLRGEDVSRKETNSEVATRLIHFPVITKSLETSDPPPVKETKCLKRMHSWNDHEGWEIRRTSNIERPWVRGERNIASVSAQETKPSFTQIRRPMKADCGGFSLPSPSESAIKFYSTSFLSSEKFTKRHDLHTEAGHSFPLLVYSGSMGESNELIYHEAGYPAVRLPVRGKGTFDCAHAKQTSFPVKATSERSVEESDNTLKTHVETAETDFNEVETKTVRLLEWLLDQSEIKS